MLNEDASIACKQSGMRSTNLSKSHPGENNAVGPPVSLGARLPAKKSLRCVVPLPARLSIDRARRRSHEMHRVLEAAENEMSIGAQLNDRRSHGAMNHAKIMKSDQPTGLMI